MKKQNRTTLLERIDLARPDLSSLQDIIIFQDSDGSYRLFNKYIITKISQYEFKVTTENTALDLTFNTLKNATAWCIFDKRDKFYDANRIHELDNKLGGIDIDIQVHARLMNKAPKSDDKLIFAAKITEDRLKKKQMVDILASYTSDSHTWQTKRYNKR